MDGQERKGGQSVVGWTDQARLLSRTLELVWGHGTGTGTGRLRDQRVKHAKVT